LEPSVGPRHRACGAGLDEVVNFQPFLSEIEEKPCSSGVDFSRELDGAADIVSKLVIVTGAAEEVRPFAVGHCAPMYRVQRGICGDIRRRRRGTCLVTPGPVF